MKEKSSPHPNILHAYEKYIYLIYNCIVLQYFNMKLHISSDFFLKDYYCTYLCSHWVCTRLW